MVTWGLSVETQGRYEFFRLVNNTFTYDFQVNYDEVDTGLIQKTDGTMYIKSTFAQTCNATLTNSLMAWMSKHSF